MLATVRSDVAVPDALVSLWKDGLVDRLELGPLSASQTENLLRIILPGRIAATSQHRLERLSRGNILFLRELVEGCREAGTLRCVDGEWRLQGGAPLPGRLVELIEHQLRRLDEHAREALEIVAFSEPLAVPVLVALTGRGVVEQLERSRCMTVSGEPPLARMAHPVYAEAVRGRTPRSRVHEIRRLLVGAHQRLGRCVGEDLLRVAAWSLDSGVPFDASHLLDAAEAVVFRGDLELGLRLAVAARRPDEQARAALVEAGSLWRLGRPREVEETLALVASSARSDADRVALARLRASNLFHTLGRFHDAMRVLGETGSQIRSPEVRLGLSSTRAVFAAIASSVDQALAICHSVQSSPGLPALARAETLTAQAAAHTAQGSCRLALLECDRWASLLTVVRRRPDLSILVEEVRARALSRVDLDLAQQHCQARYDVAEGWPPGRVAFARLLGYLAMDRGRLRTAWRYLTEAVDRMSSVRLAFVTSRSLAAMVQVAAMSGDVARAEAVLADLACAVEGADVASVPEIGLARAWRAAARGDLRTARGLALEAAETAARFGNRYWELIALHDAVRMGAAEVVSDRLTALVEQVEFLLAPTAAAHATALAASSPERLQAVSRGFERQGFVLLAAEAAAKAAGLYREGGRRSLSLLTAARVQALVERCESPLTPALVELGSLRLLSGRELEVARLVAAGLTSRQVAERLQISMRTVDNHLARVYDKLEVAGRSELRPLLVDGST